MLSTSRVLLNKLKGGNIEVSNTINSIKNILLIVLLVYATFTSVTALSTVTKNNILTSKYDTLQSDYNNLIMMYTNLFNIATDEHNDYIELSDNYTSLSDSFTKIAEQNVALIDSMDKLDAQNLSLVQSNEQYYQDLQKFTTRSELYDKYEYAILDNQNQRTDITYDQLQTAEDLCEKNGVDIDYLLSTIMVESNGISSAKSKISSATGYGQLINGTAKYVYEVLMENGKGTYNHSMALDGDLNLEMTTEYIAFLQDNSDNMNTVITKYRGMSDTSYVSKVNSYLSKVGKSVETLYCYNGRKRRYN